MWRMLTLLALASLWCSQVQADYMGTCNAMIQDWQSCEGSGDCAVKQKGIEQTCKCHVLKNGQWRFIKPGSAGMGVCGDIPTTPGPTPSPEEHGNDPTPPGDPSGHGRLVVDDPKYYLDEDKKKTRPGKKSQSGNQHGSKTRDSNTRTQGSESESN